MLMMNPAMMTNERKIWEAALLLVRRHGAAALDKLIQTYQTRQSGIYYDSVPESGPAAGVFRSPARASRRRAGAP